MNPILYLEEEKETRFHIYNAKEALHKHLTSRVYTRNDNVHLKKKTIKQKEHLTLSLLLLPARFTNRSHSTYGSSAQSDSHRADFCPNSVVSGWKN
jgi:hypothetical protein